MSVESVLALPSGPLLHRAIDADTAARYGVRLEYNPATGTPSAAYYPLVDASFNIMGFQRKVVRDGPREKSDVSRVGNTKGGEVLPFGAHVAGKGGAMVLVTEGAEDALAAFAMIRAQGKQYRVVACLGTDSWRDNLEYFAGFTKVAIAFDQDAPGKKAAVEFAGALKPDQGVILTWDKANDPNDLLRAGRSKDFMAALNNAKPYKPSGIVWGDEVWRRMEAYTAPASVPYPPEWPELNAKAGGMREAEISIWTAGSSIGKTSFLRRVKQHIVMNTTWKVGEVELEERIEKTCRGMYQFALGKPWHLATTEEKRRAHEQTYGSGKLFAVDRGLRNKRDALITQFKHLHYSYGCNVIFLDHITLGVREWGSGDGGLGDQDSMMEDILGFCESTGCHVALVSHLRKPPSGGKSWSQGAVPSEEDMKGSGSLYQIAFDIIAMSRNKQHTDEYERNVTQLHVAKCRETGHTGPADRLYWDYETMSLSPARDPPSDGDDGVAYRDGDKF